MERDLVVVIMAGGSGTRFWPLSTSERPKQFVTLRGDRSLLQATYDRLAGWVPDDRILVLTGIDFVGLVREQLPGLPETNVVGEPIARDTAGAVSLAAHLVRTRFPGSTMLVVPADHVIEPVTLFRATVESACDSAAADGAIYTFGIPPTFPATGYGYLETGASIGARAGVEHLELRRFVEKPERPRAEEFLEAGNYLWNSGMFVWPVELIWEALVEHVPEFASRLGAVPVAGDGRVAAAALQEALEPLEGISIDFAVMEKLAGIRCVRAEFSWNDVGGWLAVSDDLADVGSGNRARGVVEVRDAQENIVFCEDADETVALLGVKDLVVVRAGGRTLVAHKERLDELKGLVKEQLTRT